MTSNTLLYDVWAHLKLFLRARILVISYKLRYIMGFEAYDISQLVRYCGPSRVKPKSRYFLLALHGDAVCLLQQHTCTEIISDNIVWKIIKLIYQTSQEHYLPNWESVNYRLPWSLIFTICDRSYIAQKYKEHPVGIRRSSKSFLDVGPALPRRVPRDVIMHPWSDITCVARWGDDYVIANDVIIPLDWLWSPV